MSGEGNPAYAPFFGSMGAACAMVFSGTCLILLIAQQLLIPCIVREAKLYKMAVINCRRVHVIYFSFSFRYTYL